MYMITTPMIENEIKSLCNAYSERRRMCTTCGDQFCEKHLGAFFTEQRLTCANHADEEMALIQIGWNNFICPKCGSDYSIGRKMRLI